MGGPLEWSEVETLLKILPPTIDYKNVFVETGTYHGDTTFLMAKYFKEVYTCEIHRELLVATAMKAQNKRIDNIKFFLCDSVPFLKDALPTISNTAIYFLDAHISGADSGWNGYKRVPLMEELEAILEQKGQYSNIIIIDDARFFDGSMANKPDDWAHISVQGINALVEKYTKRYFSFVKNDRLFLLIN